MLENRRLIRYLLLLGAFLFLNGCTQKPSSEPPAQPVPTASPQSAAQPLAPSPSAPSSQPASVAETPAAPVRPSGPIEFTDVTAQAGIHFKHNTGAFGKKYLPETMGSGVCFIDYDNDGWQDIFFVNSMDWPGHKSGASLSPRSITTITMARSPT